MSMGLHLAFSGLAIISWSWISLTTALHVGIFSYVLVHCLRSRREPTSTLVWIFLTWSFPFIGALVYFAFGVNRIPAKGWRKYQADQALKSERDRIVETQAPPLVYWEAVHGNRWGELPDGDAQSFNAAMDAVLADYPLLGGNHVRLLVTGDEAYPAMFAAIREARNHIHLQSFIIRRDSVGREFLELLRAKAGEGVKVRIMYDRFGSTWGVLSGFFHAYAGTPNLQLVGWTQANPIKRQFKLNLRNHRKILVVDGQAAFTGGINLGADNCRGANGQLPIQDYHFHVTGPIVQELQYSFLRDWYFMTDENPEELLHADHFPEVKPVDGDFVRVVNSGPTTTEMGVISDVFFSAIVGARRDIDIVVPYFVPSRDILQALRSAAQRGVNVRLILPRHNNHAYAGLAGRALYEELLRAGVQIFERRPPFMHAKACVIDDTLALVGTANLDERSLRLNYETNLAVYSERFIYDLKSSIRREQENSTPIELTAWQHRPVYHRLLENFCHLLAPVL